MAVVPNASQGVDAAEMQGLEGRGLRALWANQGGCPEKREAGGSGEKERGQQCLQLEPRGQEAWRSCVGGALGASQTLTGAGEVP